MHLVGGKRRLDLTEPVVMGVVNVTPDSFSDGGRFQATGVCDSAHAPLDQEIDLGLVLRQAQDMLAAGAKILDVGGESSRPGADPVSEQAELRRVIPVIERLSDLDTMLSVDTYKPAVAAAALAAGCHLVNDISGGSNPKMREVVADTGAAICLMHMQGEPRTMQQAPVYVDVCRVVEEYLQQQVALMLDAGISAESVVIDPGFGFGKQLQHNLLLLEHIERLSQLGVPVLAGLSRKSMLQTLTGRAVGDRLAGSVALAALAARQGARIIRGHDIAATVDAVKIGFALREETRKNKT